MDKIQRRVTGGTGRAKRLLIDSGAVDGLAGEEKRSAADIARLNGEGYWPPGGVLLTMAVATVNVIVPCVHWRCGVAV